MSSRTCLLVFLVGVSPCAAIRENSFDLIDTLRSLEEGKALLELEEVNELSQQESEQLMTNSDLHPFKSCPGGTNKEYIKGEPVHCVYDNGKYGGLNLYDPSEPSLGKHFQAGKGEQRTLRYNRDSESINMTLTFGNEFRLAWSDNYTLYKILGEFALEMFEHNATMKSEFEGWIQEVKDGHFSDGHSDFLSGVHGVESDMFAAVFVLEHIAEHAVIEGVVALLSLVTKAGADGVVYGEAFLAKYTGFQMVAAAQHSIHFLHTFLHYVMTPYLIERSLNLIFVRTQDSWLRKESHAEDFVNRLVFRSKCVKDRLHFDAAHNPFDVTNINPVVSDVCKPSQTQLLSKLFERTHKMYEHIFDKIASIGKCLNPGNNPGYIFASKKRYQSKVYCIERMYRELRESRGKPGQLWTALVYMTTVMAETDELLVNKHYGHIMGDKFGVHAPEDLSNKWSELQDLVDANATNVTPEEKFGTCFMVLSTHRAYETSLSILAESITIWTQTFGRRLIAANVRGTWWPCARVFEKPGEENKVAGVGSFCKNENNIWLPEQRRAEQVSCSTPLNYPQWICHKRNWWLIRAKEDAMWCKTAGTYEGYNYWHFGDDLSKCGCSCCKRANAYKSLWPELEMGGH